MFLYLVQHGLSMSKEDNPDRPLTELGREDVARVAECLNENATLNLDRILHSGVTRAKQTAEILREKLMPESGVEADQDLAPMDDPVVWAERLKCLDKDIMLVGHLPYLAKLASLLLCGNPDQGIVSFTNGGVVCLKRTEQSNWTVNWVVIPDIVS